jgi:hypothetical protein
MEAVGLTTIGASIEKFRVRGEYDFELSIVGFAEPIGLRDGNPKLVRF